MKLGIAEILEKTSTIKGTDEKVAFLRNNFNPALATVIKYALDPTIKWLLPEGTPPFKPNPHLDQQSALYSEARRLYLFVEGGNPNLNQVRREFLFIQLLENLDAKDAALVAAIKDKKIPYRGINAKLIEQAFPGLLPAVATKKESTSEQAIPQAA